MLLINSSWEIPFKTNLTVKSQMNNAWGKTNNIAFSRLYKLSVKQLCFSLEGKWQKKHINSPHPIWVLIDGGVLTKGPSLGGNYGNSLRSANEWKKLAIPICKLRIHVSVRLICVIHQLTWLLGDDMRHLKLFSFFSVIAGLCLLIQFLYIYYVFYSSYNRPSAI